MKINLFNKLIKLLAWLFMLSSFFTLSACSNSNKFKEALTLENKEAAQKPTSSADNTSELPKPVASLINESGKTLVERFKVPEGFERVTVSTNSFQEYLRNSKLKPHGSKVLYYNGDEKNRTEVYEAVFSVNIGNRDLHQCADAVMLLRAEYLYSQKRYSEIHFNFVDGFKADYQKWSQGYRISVNGSNTSWIKSKQANNSYEEFRKYMDVVFAYASTLSLEKELKPINKNQMSIGDVFIKGGSPGHAVIVVDMAENKSTGEKLFMLAQSYMPAQETQVLANTDRNDITPWYSLNFSDKLHTPEWTFNENQLRSFAENTNQR